MEVVDWGAVERVACWAMGGGRNGLVLVVVHPSPGVAVAGMEVLTQFDPTGQHVELHVRLAFTQAQRELKRCEHFAGLVQSQHGVGLSVGSKQR